MANIPPPPTAQFDPNGTVLTKRSPNMPPPVWTIEGEAAAMLRPARIQERGLHSYFK